MIGENKMQVDFFQEIGYNEEQATFLAILYTNSDGSISVPRSVLTEVMPISLANMLEELANDYRM